MMRILSRSAAAGIFLGLVLGGCGHGPVTPDPVIPAASQAPAAGLDTPSGIVTFTPSPPSSPSLSRGLHRVHDPGQVTGTLAGPCHYRDGGQLPDPRCTPGAYDPAVTTAVLCSGSYSTRDYRPPVYQTSRFKYESAYPAYGVASGTPTELDHLVSLELGGSNDASNLWPEQPPTPNRKDAVENELHAAVCAGRVTLAAAQRAIAQDWLTAEEVLGLGAPPSPVHAVAPASSAPAPVYTHSSAPAPVYTHSSAPAHVSCYPLTSGGNCYEPGEFCRSSDHGATGVAGDGKAIACRDNNGWRWEPA